MQSKDKHEEIMVLAHDSVAGYRPAFYVIFAIGLLYLGYILWKSL